MNTLESQVEEMGGRVIRFASDNNLPINFFDLPESARVRASSREAFATLEYAYAQQCERMAVLQRGWRFRAVAKLQGELILPRLGKVKWLEIDEPTKAQAEAMRVGVVSLRFIYPDLERLTTVLKARNVPTDIYDDEVVARLAGDLQTIEFSDTHTDTALDLQLASGEAMEVRT